MCELGDALMRRNRLEVIAKILSLCKNPATKARITFEANLSFLHVKNYLSSLESLGLIEVQHHSQTRYGTTMKGRELLRSLRSCFTSSPEARLEQGVYCTKIYRIAARNRIYENLYLQ